MDGEGSEQDLFFGPGDGRRAVEAVAETAEAGESIGDPRSQNRNDRLGQSTLIGEDDRNSQILRHLARDRARERADVAE
jgi:hypothetical protein